MITRLGSIVASGLLTDSFRKKYSKHYSLCQKDSNLNDASSIFKNMKCDERACSSKMDMMRRAMEYQQAPTDNKTSIKSNSTVVNTEVSSYSSSSSDCPLDKEDLGNRSWSIIHTISMNITDQLSDKDRHHILQFLQSFAYLYPCHICAEDFQAYVKEHPPRYATILYCIVCYILSIYLVQTCFLLRYIVDICVRLKDRVVFILWCCEFHNYINDKLGKDQYTCDINTLEERWRYGSPACGYDAPPLDSSLDSPTSSSTSFSSPTDSDNDNNNSDVLVVDDRSDGDGESDNNAPDDASGDLNQDLALPYSQEGVNNVVDGAESEEALKTPDPLIIITNKDRGSDDVTGNT